MIFLSVIIPVYQGEAVILRSIMSVLGQSYNDLELIIVDDGSTDATASICQRVVEDYDNVKYIFIENSGPFQARKVGVENAEGELVTFVDADDWLDFDAYESLLRVYLENTPDILLSTYRLGEEGEITYHSITPGFYSRTVINEKILPNMIWDDRIGGRRIDSSVCCKIFKKCLYTKVTQDITERIDLGEDALVSFPAIAASDSIYITSLCKYHYCISPNSSTRNHPLKRVLELQSFKKNISNKMQEYCVYDFSYQIDNYMRHFIEMITQSWFGCDRSSQMYSFPYNEIRNMSQINLYGAGNLGRSYRRIIANSGFIELMGWYDKKSDGEMMVDGCVVRPVKDLIKQNVPILIAIIDEEIAEEAKKEMIKLGISSKLILWYKPILIG